MQSRNLNHGHWTATLWVHPEGFSKENVLFNRAAISTDIPLHQLVSVSPAGRGQGPDDEPPSEQEPFIFQAHDLSPEDKHRHSNLQISVSARIASLYGLHNRATVTLRLVDPSQHTASHVELAYRDVHLDRSEMLRVCSQSLRGHSLFQGQVVTFVSGSLNFTVKTIYVRGERRRSALFLDSTKPVFRSETARFIILIQMSKEMWDFDPYGSGETLWTKCVEDFLVDLFEHWSRLKARHLVTVALFTRMTYEDEEPDAVRFKDFYKVIASEVPSTDSTVLLSRMRSEYRNFLKTTHVQQTAAGVDMIKGVLSTASQGCVLEAINLATSHFSKACNDPDLLRTEKSLLIVSPSVGLFEAEKNLLRMTTERVVCSGFGIDLVCLAHKPLHAVPLFAVRPTAQALSASEAQNSAPSVQATPKTAGEALVNYRQTGTTRSNPLRQYQGWTFVKPSWIGVAFYQSRSRAVSVQAQRLRLTYAPSTRIHELQSLGSTSNSHILKRTHLDPSSLTLDKLDARTFSLPKPPRKRPPISRHVSNSSADRLPRRQSRPGLLPEKAQIKVGPPRNPSPAPSTTTTRSVTSSRAFRLLRLGVGLGKTAATTGSATVESAESKFSAPAMSLAGRGAVEEKFKASLSRNVSSSASATVPNIAPTIAAPTTTAPTTTPAPTISSDSIPIRSAPIQISAKRTESPAATLDKPGSSSSNRAGSWNVDREEAFRTSSLSRKNASLEKRYLAAKNVPAKWDDLAPWLVTVQPSRSTLLHEPALFASWRHLFAIGDAPEAGSHGRSELHMHSSHNHNSQLIKWKALTSPAGLPLTTDECPRPALLESDDYNKSPYSVAVHADDGDAPGRAMRKLVYTRLSRGFQLCVGDRAAATGGVSKVDSRIFSPLLGHDESMPIVMVRGNTVHLLSHDAGAGSITVTRYTRLYAGQDSGALRYEPEISTLLDDEYHKRIFYLSGFEEENWNSIDLGLSLTGVKSRARWALLPTDIPHNRRGFYSSDDTDEEVRLEGIRKLTVLWQRTKFFHLNGREKAASATGNIELSPLAIEYATSDPSAYLASHLENSPLLLGNQTVTSTRLNEGLYKTTSFDLHLLARDLQGPKGIKMRDRRWHLKWHPFCFEGVELVSFLLANFEDLEDRDSAVDFGNVLMGKGLFQHVQLKHRFRDGNFFYTLSPEYQAVAKETKGWFGSRKTPATAAAAATATSAAAQEHGHAGFFSPSLKPVRFEHQEMESPSAKPRVLLSAAIKYDVDPRRKSGREEMVDLHYDRLHNPANAFHIMIEWESHDVTSKLVEEAVSSWSGVVERYGLKLVQLPMQEIGAIAQANPFRTPYVIKIALSPPPPPPPHSSDGQSMAHCKAILGRKGYILDYEASFRFPSNVDVSYTWGDRERAGFSKDQYVHVSGGLLVQIVDDETLILLANRLTTSRNPTLRREGPPRPGTAVSRGAATTTAPSTTGRSIMGSSPLLRPQRLGSPPPAADAARADKSLIELKEELEEFCADKAALASLYAEVARAQVAQTPAQRATRTPMLDANIPGLDLAAETLALE